MRFGGICSKARRARAKLIGMAKKTETIVTMTDDIDGSTAAETVTFGYEGSNYEIDLSKANVKAFERAMSLYVGHARKVRSTRKASTGRGGSKHDLSVVREWAKANGYEVSDRGRVAAAVLDAYEAAN